MKKKKYSIPLVWQMGGRVTVEADSEEEAKEIALGPDHPLPKGYYIDDSAEVDDIAGIEIIEE